ncbi:MAG: hypothetical protein JO314_00070 [Acidobacteria bacterium]|nr:hypothetical protein [Acidobacteriota bacterium]
MKVRSLSLTITGLLLSASAFADMAPPSPRPTTGAGLSGGAQSVSYSLTPLGWIMIVGGIIVIVVLTVSFLRIRAANKAK